jgi:hypothetical protein
VQQVLANPWRKTVSAGRIVQRELQPYAAADLGFIHEGQRPYASAGQISPPCWAAVTSQDPDSPRPGSRNPGTVTIWQGHLASFSSSAILANFFYTVYAIGPEVTSPEKTSRLVLDKFFFLFVTFYIGAIFLLYYVSSLGRVEGRNAPRTFRGYGRRSGLKGPSFQVALPGNLLD